jgi:hypothetical protein
VRVARAAALVVALVTGAAGCAASDLSPAVARTPPASSEASHVPKSPVSMMRSAAPSQGPARTLADEVVAKRVDRALTGNIGEFASTGRSIAFSSDLAGDAATDAAPDLWRLTPGPGAVPELVWRNPARNHVLTRLTGDLDTLAFVDLPLTGEASWDLWVVPRDGDPVRLDSHPGDPSVSSLVPSIAVYEPTVAWTAFDIGPAGPVSRLLVASAPDWTPRVIAERLAAEAELWLPSLRGATIAYTEVVYAPDRSSDERRVYLGGIGEPAEAHRRLDASGLATMPLVLADGVIWKEADRGFNMFNWGRLHRWDAQTGEAARMRLGEHDYVNYPSAGSRFVTWWGSETNALVVFDLVRGHAWTVDRHAADGNRGFARPHIAGDLLVWLAVESDPIAGHSETELRYAFMPPVKKLVP